MDKKIFIIVGILAIGIVVVSFLVVKKPKEFLSPQPTLEKELYLYNWEDYLSLDVIKDFEQKYGVKVTLETFDDSDFAFSVIQSQPDKYDLFVIEDDYVRILKKLKLLTPLDHQKIPNLKNLKKEARENPYDFGNQYCLPYVAGFTGVLINTKYVKDYNGTRDIFWNEKYKGKIVMPNNSIEVLLNALFALGYDPDQATKEQFERAKELAIKQKDLVIEYTDPYSRTLPF